MGASISKTRGFTLVEISIVMIIIGLLIGGTFGGMKLVENMQVNKTVQDLKAIESAALTFKDTYGRLPGDMPNTAARLPNCTVAPCATGGNGNKTIGTTNLAGGAITNTDENFTFWHHLAAADIMNLGIENTLDMSFGAGQPSAAIDAGYRVTDRSIATGCTNFTKAAVYVTDLPDSIVGPPRGVNCTPLANIDRKMDDGLPYHGRFMVGFGCDLTTLVCAAPPQFKATSSTGAAIYDMGF